MSQTTLVAPPLKIRFSMSMNKIDTFSNECDDRDDISSVKLLHVRHSTQCGSNIQP